MLSEAVYAFWHTLSPPPTPPFTMLDLILLLVLGGLIGWAASKIMGTDPEQGVLMNVIVGIVGALLGGFLLGPLVSEGSILDEGFDIGAILVSLVGAIIVLFIYKAIRGRT